MKQSDLREACLNEYGEDFIKEYDSLNDGIPIGDLAYTIRSIEKIEAVKHKCNKATVSEDKRHARVERKWQKWKPFANVCPDCQSRCIGLNDIVTNRFKRFFLECENCHWCGASKSTIRGAVRSWNKDR